MNCLGSVVRAFGVLVLSHAAYSTILYIGWLKITEKEFSEPPMSVVLELIVGLFLYMWPALTSPRKSLPVLEDSDENSSEDSEHQYISLCPQVIVSLSGDKFEEKIDDQGLACRPAYEKRECDSDRCEFIGTTHFRCPTCNGENHQEFQKAPLEIKHHLHRKHFLQLVLSDTHFLFVQTRECYCCAEDLEKVFYYCSACDFAINIACVEKPPLLAIDHEKWHEHPLALFPRRTSLSCNVCALVHLSCPIYMCPPCDFVIHQKCISLPRVIRISRHPHRISFTPSFDLGDWSCRVCQRKIDNEYGGYSCIKNGCLYAAHSRCATQSNVWDGIELEGVPEEIEEEVVEPFVRISDGIIQHFLHDHHHLRLDDSTCGDYDENKQCQACVTPIYFGSFYSCMKCDFILHEECANLSRKMHHPIHPHLLNLLGGYENAMKNKDSCSACPSFCTAGFFYKCSEKECKFQLHVQCATISEPLVHESHEHPLFLTSKPDEHRQCCVCRYSTTAYTSETFNCIECDFALCFVCATLPQRVMYKHDKHMLTLSYGKETSTATYWCEVCEGKVNPKERFYTCEELCCVTLHIECLIGKDLYMKPGLSCVYHNRKIGVLSNNHHMSRPFCFYCRKRCPYKIVFQSDGFIYCSQLCIAYCKLTF